MASVKIEVGKKDFVWIVPLVVVLVVGAVYAYGTSNPSVMGHSAGELEVDNAFCNKIIGHDCGIDNEGGSWPEGSYCIMKAGGACPSGFTSKLIQAAIGTHAHDLSPQEGPAGDSYATGSGFSNFYFYFCCK